MTHRSHIFTRHMQCGRQEHQCWKWRGVKGGSKSLWMSKVSGVEGQSVQKESLMHAPSISAFLLVFSIVCQSFSPLLSLSFFLWFPLSLSLSLSSYRIRFTVSMSIGLISSHGEISQVLELSIRSMMRWAEMRRDIMPRSVYITQITCLIFESKEWWIGNEM